MTGLAKPSEKTEWWGGGKDEEGRGDGAVDLHALDGGEGPLPAELHPVGLVQLGAIPPHPVPTWPPTGPTRRGGGYESHTHGFSAEGGGARAHPEMCWKPRLSHLRDTTQRVAPSRCPPPRLDGRITGQLTMEMPPCTRKVAEHSPWMMIQWRRHRFRCVWDIKSVHQLHQL